MSDTAHLIAYWHASLTDADRVGIDAKQVRASPTVKLSELAAGRISGTLANQLWSKVGDATVGRPTQTEPIGVLLCPIVAVRSNETLFPLWVPALLARDGELLAPDDLLPWVDRQLLEPTERPRIILGAVDELDRFLAVEMRPNQDDGWQAYWAYCCRMFQQITGLEVARFALDGYRTEKERSYVVPADTVQGSSLHVRWLYERLRAERSFPPLFQRLAARKDADERPLLTQAEQRPLAARHVGQLGAAFPLSASQREALHHFLAGGPGEILAVNGPPGTGKTTLIQSVVATLWVEAALAGEEPPIILAASTNNRAVTNIVDSFAKVAGENGLLARRWLPDVTSYGLFCASESQMALVTEKGLIAVFPKSEHNRSGFFAGSENSTYVSQASTAFLDCCAELFERRPASIEDAQVLLHHQLVEVVEELRGALSLWDRVKDVRERNAAAQRSHGSLELAVSDRRSHVQEAKAAAERLWHITAGWKRLKANRSFFDRFRRTRVEQANRDYFTAHADVIQPPAMDDGAIEQAIRAAWDKAQQRKAAAEAHLRQFESDQQELDRLNLAWERWCQRYGLSADAKVFEAFLDTGLRFEAFCLATHYWEARWLLEARQMLRAPQEALPPLERQMARWRRYAKLTPCFVSTLYMAPRFFSFSDGREHLPLYDFLDVLIVDEAGQVPTDIGAATFALARRALVVGDTAQIEPIFKLVSTIDAGNLKRHKAAITLEEQTTLRAQGLSAVEGSLMLVAQRASVYRKQAFVRGMFLSEHRRCLPEIIAVCNELAYAGSLDPRRPAENGLPLPALGYVNVLGRCVENRASRENKTEAETIAGWLSSEQRRLEEYYGKPVEEFIGVVTPFARQAQLLRQALQTVGLERITVGTVHTFQGAERRVIVFSPVYDKAGSFFFDRGVNMLNVAISRAQDSFLVFGNMVIFEPAPTVANPRPSSVLARHLLQGVGVELDAKGLGLSTMTPPGAQVELLNDLQAHSDVLAHCLRTARQRVVIVSPYLSEAALEADKLDALIAAAIGRGVNVIVYTDSQLDVVPLSGLKPRAAAARSRLQRCGVDLRIVGRIHNKTLCMDDTLLVIGSFNWLSAVRDERHQYQRYESSVQCEGQGVSALIAETLGKMEQMPLVAEDALQPAINSPIARTRGN